MSKLTIRDVDVRGKRVLVRVDFNVPIKEDGEKIEITDDTRIREALPTINYLREHKAKTILMSHFGRPKGKRVPKYSLRPVADHLHTLIDHPVIFSHDTIGDVPQKIVRHMQDGDVALLENLRFQPEEEANDRKFAAALATVGVILLESATPSQAQATGSIRLHITKAGLIVGVGGGSGVLTYRGKRYRLALSGIDIGSLGVAEVDLVGIASNLTSPAAIAGTYGGVGAGGTFVRGGQVATLQNGNGVILRLRGVQAGFQVSIGFGGMTIASR